MDRAQLEVREQLIKSHHAMLDQLRGLLKLFGLRMGKATTPERRAERLQALFAQKPELLPILSPLIDSLGALEQEITHSSPVAGTTMGGRAADSGLGTQAEDRTVIRALQMPIRPA